MVSVNQLNIVIGLSAAYFANYMFLNMRGSENALVMALGIDQHTWRWMLGIESIPALMYFLLLFTIPESPRWLVMKGKQDMAENTLKRLFPIEQVTSQFNEIKATVAEQTPALKQRLSFLFSPAMRFALLIGIIVGISQQATGVNAIYFYAPTVFEQSGVGTNAAFMQAIWIGIINIVFTCGCYGAH